MQSWPPRPRLSRHAYKAHGLGNDYLVFGAGDDWDATRQAVGVVCDPHSGLGSDGIVVVVSVEEEGARARVQARMFNPDGGEFERSGNGLRVLGSWLARSIEGVQEVEVHIAGDTVVMQIHSAERGTHDISVEMGRARSTAAAIALDESALRTSLPGYEIVPVSVGNPHLVVLAGPDGHAVSELCLAELGPKLTAHAALAHGANVQLAEPLGEGVCRALIWERGVGRTSASGTSSCAVAVAMAVTGRLSYGDIRVEMPGGHLDVRVDESLAVTLRGPVEEVYDASLTDGFLRSLSGLSLS